MSVALENRLVRAWSAWDLRPGSTDTAGPKCDAVNALAELSGATANQIHDGITAHLSRQLQSHDRRDIRAAVRFVMEMVL